MKTIFKFLRARLSEPSTLAGLSALGVLVGLPEGAVSAGAQLLAAACAVAAVIAPEKAADK